MDCYAGHGGDPILPDPHSKALSLAGCKSACEMDNSCEGIITQAGNEAVGLCYKRRNLQLSNCVNDANWNLFIKAEGISHNSLLMLLNCHKFVMKRQFFHTQAREARPPVLLCLRPARLQTIRTASSGSRPTLAPYQIRTTILVFALQRTICESFLQTRPPMLLWSGPHTL